jgi:hypothetical protein
MSRIFVLPALLGLALLPAAVKAGPTAVPAGAVRVAPDQFYGPWQDDHKNYWHREYYFKVRPTDAEYQKHEVIFYKKGPRFFYYYSPESGQFWGRGFYGCHGNELYQFLQPGERAGTLNQINFDSKPVGVPPKLGAVTPPAGGQAVTPGTPGAGTPAPGTPGVGTPAPGTPGAGTPAPGAPGAGAPAPGTPGNKAGTPPGGTPPAGDKAAAPPGGTPTLLDLPPDDKDGAPPISKSAPADKPTAARAGAQLKLPPDEPTPQTPFGG